MLQIQSITAIICLLLLSTGVFAEPTGFITFSIYDADGDYLVCEISVTGGPARILDSTDINPFSGIDAPPFLGDRCVMARSRPDIDEIGIYLISRTGALSQIIATVVPYNARSPAFSFDGQNIAYALPNVNLDGDDEIHTVLPSGQFDTTIYTTAGSQDVRRVRFSPDGQNLLVSMYNGNSVYCVYTLPVNGGVLQEITTLPDKPQQAVYSPDGRYLACVAESTLYIANADGSNPQLVNLSGASVKFPCFSPDSKYVVVVSSSDNLFRIIDTSDLTIARTITVSNNNCNGICWHLGASQSSGKADKVKINKKKVSVKLRDFVPGALPQAGLMQVDGTVIPFYNEALWQNKKDKKYLYKDKTNKRKGNIILKKGKAKFSAKKLTLTEGDDYHVSTNIPFAVNAGEVSIAEIIPLDKKGKYKAPK